MSNSKKLAVKLGLVCIAMFGFGFALVPLYSVFCKVTGINGKTGGQVAYTAGAIDESRTITVEFLATNNENLAWEFKPTIKKLKLHPGEIKQTAYYAKNNTDHIMHVQAIPSVTPGIGAKHMKKTECFCFTRQTFKAHQDRVMPLIFHIDRDLPKNIKTLTLSYTMFDLDKLERKG